MKQVAFAIAVAACLTGCHLSDPVNGRSAPHGCQGDYDCSEHGICQVDGTCFCATGYEGDSCGSCAGGYHQLPSGECAADGSGTNNATNNATNNGTAGTNNGTAGTNNGTTNNTNNATTGCTAGSTDASCMQCAPACDHGACDAGSCSCDTGWTGTACDGCAPGYSGPNCDPCPDGTFGSGCIVTCDDIAGSTAWWNPDFGVRRAAVVTNMTPNTIRMGTYGSLSFDHASLVMANQSLADGRDVRIVYQGGSRPRIVGVDSGWGSADTTLWFAMLDDLPPADFQVFYLYTDNPTAGAPDENVAAVLHPDHGWAYSTTTGAPLYSAHRHGSGSYSMQFREIAPDVFEVYVLDSSDGAGPMAHIEVDNRGGNPVYSKDFGDLGDSTTPGNAADMVTGLPGTFTVNTTIQDTSRAAIWLGSDENRTATAGAPVNVVVTFQHGSPVDPAPAAYLCPTETYPP